tara:strand:- start:250 stop:699 length:450 start_codon:yes stop_codon:yes gene_type:complete
MRYLTTLLFFALLFVLFGCDSFDNESKLRDKLERIESTIPKEKISIKNLKSEANRSVVERGGFFKSPIYKIDGYHMSGLINNSSLLAHFKDFKLELTYYSKTGTIIDTETVVLYENLNPQESKNFKIKINSPEDTHESKASVLEATYFN